MKRSLFPMLLLVLLGCGAGVPAVPPCSTTVCPSGQVCNPASGACEVQPSRCASVSCVSPMSCDGATGLCVFPLGDLIDRAGRPLINLAVTNPFDALVVSGQPEAGPVTRDRYNRDKSFPWSAWAAPFAQTLALYDGLDGTCGHPFALPALGPTRFATLAGLLAADTLLIDTSKNTCASYMSVERNGLTGMASTDCGGRKLDYDVVDGTFLTIIGIGSGATDNVGISVTATPTFPYLP